MECLQCGKELAGICGMECLPCGKELAGNGNHEITNTTPRGPLSCLVGTAAARLAMLCSTCPA